MFKYQYGRINRVVYNIPKVVPKHVPTVEIILIKPKDFN